MKEDHFTFSKEDYLFIQKEDAYVQALLAMKTEVNSQKAYPLTETGPNPKECISLRNTVPEIEFQSKFDINKIISNDSNGETQAVEKESKMHSSVVNELRPETLNTSDNKGTIRLNELMEKFNYDKLPVDLQQLIWGMYDGLPDDFSVPNDLKPDWLDMNKFKIGQSFTKKYYTCLNFSDMLSLVVLFSFPDVLEALIFTKNSGTPFTAFRRYLTTARRVTSWFEHDIWSKDNPGYRNLKTVRAMHLNISKRLNSREYKYLQNQLTMIGSTNKPKVWSTKKQEILEDFHSLCPFTGVTGLDNRNPNKVFVSQLDMSITQFANVGLIVTYPEKFGAGSATREELEGFLHMWRGIGYLLGIKDEFNFCAGSLEEVVQRCHNVLDYWVKPNFQNITEDWEHMSRCLAEGLGYVFGFSNMFEPSMMYLCWTLGTPTLTLEKSLNFSQIFAFYFIRFTMTSTLRVPGMLPLTNWLLRLAMTKASSLTPKQLSELENKNYDYQMTKFTRQGKNEDSHVSKAPLLLLAYMLRLLF